MMEKNLYPEIPKEKFAFIHKDERIHDEKLQTKSISYLGDAWLRFSKNKSSVVAFCLIVFLLLFASVEMPSCVPAPAAHPDIANAAAIVMTVTAIVPFLNIPSLFTLIPPFIYMT